MSDDLCVNIFDEIAETTGNLSSGIFQGFGDGSNINPWTAFFALMTIVFFVTMTVS